MKHWLKSDAVSSCRLKSGHDELSTSRLFPLSLSDLFQRLTCHRHCALNVHFRMNN